MDVPGYYAMVQPEGFGPPVLHGNEITAGS